MTQELHHFALAVSQAGAFIHCHSESSLSSYRELYQRKRDNLLQNQEIQDSDPYIRIGSICDMEPELRQT